ncbi:lytic transglycosylase domain-containing protein [Sphingorhabdus pulchriflava]|uniref:Lytic transglycosylase domain-containing protein n=1 Tax=Sphingorhabdus pulchriflava TaxID=2292257 RepID=A0A371B507_9SPHN|nr:lytic transglycosylase domain-containing protein [Sphingorhabdus pulchriflava]RDV02676.1 lytic transglycosylase domain-containing protein [Sphingorhabdus pulchriflava]
MPTKISQPTAPVPIQRAIAVAAQRTGTDFGYLFDQARIESGFRPQARATTSSAAGLYQFTRQTWLAILKQHGAEHGFGWAADSIEKTPGSRYRVTDPVQREQILQLRFDPDAAALMAGELAGDNAVHLADVLGHAPESVDLYLAHFLGAHGARKFLTAWQTDPQQAAAPLLPEAARANPAIFYAPDGTPRSVDAIRARFASKFGGLSDLAVTATSARDVRQSASVSANQLGLRSIRPMPHRLSLAFAQDAYRSLQSREGGAL